MTTARDPVLETVLSLTMDLWRAVQLFAWVAGLRFVVRFRAVCVPDTVTSFGRACARAREADIPVSAGLVDGLAMLIAVWFSVLWFLTFPRAVKTLREVGA